MSVLERKITIYIRGRQATTGNTSADRRISKGLLTWRWGTMIGEVNCTGGVKNNPRFALNAIVQPRQPGVHFLKSFEWSLSTYI